MPFFTKFPNLASCNRCPPSDPDDNVSTPGPAIPTPLNPTPSNPPEETNLPTYPIKFAPTNHHSTSRGATIGTAPSPPLFTAFSTLDTATRLQELIEKYDPRSANVPEIWRMSEHRDMVRTLFLDNILYATARLHRHTWILGSTNEAYTQLCGKERWDLIDEDLERYTKSIKDVSSPEYQFWLTCFIQRQELERVALPPTLQHHGRTLAVLELASHPNTASTISQEERELLKDLEHRLVAENHTWSQANAIGRQERFGLINRHARRKGLVSRVLMATFGGSTLIIPMIIMTLDNRLITTLLTTSVFTLAIGIILAFWMDDADSKDMIAATAAYAAVLVVFVGT